MMFSSSSSPSLKGLAPDEAAAQWIIRIDTGPLTLAEQAELDAWRAESGANAAAFARAEAAWGVFDQPNDDPTLNAIRASALSASREPRRGLWLGVGVGVAASFLAAIAFNADQLPFLNKQDAPLLAANGAPASDEFVSAKGERRTIRLADGSAITLNTDSAVRVAYVSDTRLVHLLRGQVLFDVAKDPQRPFIVQAGDQQVTALGTIFEVRLDADRMKVTLVEGKVVVDDADRGPQDPGQSMVPTILAPGQALVTIGGSKPELATIDVDQQLRWREGFVEFQDATLADAVLEMNRYANKPIIIRDAAMEDLRVSGVFRTGNNERFAAIVGELLPIQHRKLSDGGVELSRTR